jgi:hypothetical protein
MSEAPQRPTDDNREAWRDYWTALGMPWRTEPEIDAARQQYLAERRAIPPDIERGRFPFRNEHGSITLTRADVEWLLATHQSGGVTGPVDWSDAQQRERMGLDLRGADLRGTDLHHLPLTRLRGGPSSEEWRKVSLDKSALAALHLEGADLHHAQLQGAALRLAQLQHATLWAAHLHQANLHDAQLHGTYLYGAHFQGASLRKARLDEATTLTAIQLDADTRLADVVWHDAPLTRIRWEQAPRLGDESAAWRAHDPEGKVKAPEQRLQEFQAAVRANRQLAVALRAQGMNEDADRYAYRAQVLQRQVLRRQGYWLRYLGSQFLDTIAGYGYRPGLSLLTYLAVIVSFAAAYFLLGRGAPLYLTPREALITSIVSFHGRGFFPGTFTLASPLLNLVAAEAISGLLIEITFIATFTQRFFAR